MSLVVAVKSREGIALGADSRRIVKLGDSYETFDDEEKLWAFAAPHDHIGVALYGYAAGLPRMAELHAEFAAQLPAQRLSVEDFARRLAAFISQPSRRMVAIVAGYDGDGTSHVFVVDTPDHGEPTEHHAGSVGITWGGQREFVDRLLQGYDPRLGEVLDDVDGLDAVQMRIPLDRIMLKGSAELARFLIGTTIDAERFIEGLCGVGGAIQLLTITATEGMRWVQRAAADRRAEWYEIVEAAPARTSVPADGVSAGAYTL